MLIKKKLLLLKELQSTLVYTLGNLMAKESLWTIGLRRPDGITSYISKFQDDTMSLEVAEIRFSNLVL